MRRQVDKSAPGSCLDLCYIIMLKFRALLLENYLLKLSISRLIRAAMSCIVWVSVREKLVDRGPSGRRQSICFYKWLSHCELSALTFVCDPVRSVKGSVFWELG